MAIIGIVAVDRNGAIGKGGTIPWHYSEDLKFFKRQTSGNVCVMGHRTWLGLIKPLPNRLNIVLSTQATIASRESVIVLRDRSSVLSLKAYLACDLYIIGGAQIYQTFLDDIEKWVVTEIPLAVEDADTLIPNDYLKGFKAYDSLELDGGLKISFHDRKKERGLVPPS
jgi:dihydrofolate reductase